MDLDEDSTITAGQSGADHDPLSPSTNFSRGRSKVWSEFVVAADGKKVICRQCGDSLAYSNSHSTSSMLKHLKRKHLMDLYPSTEEEHVKATAKTVGKKNAKVKKATTLTNHNTVLDNSHESLEPSIQHGPLVFRGQYCVRMKWTDHTDTFLGAFSRLYSEELYRRYFGGGENFFKAHRVILSSASDFFDETFKMTPNGQHPIIFLKDTKALELRILLDFIYKGEISIPPSLIQDLVRIGTQMKVRGLCDFQFNEYMKSAVSNINQCNGQSDTHIQSNGNQQLSGSHPSPTLSPISSSFSHSSLNTVTVPYTSLYNSCLISTAIAGQTPPVSPTMTNKLITTPAGTQAHRQILVANSPSVSGTLNHQQKTGRSDNCPSSHILAPTASTVDFMNNSNNNNNMSGVPALKRFRILAPLVTPNKIESSSHCDIIPERTSSVVPSQMDHESCLHTDDRGTILLGEGDPVLESEKVGLASPSGDSISGTSIKTEIEDVVQTHQHMELHPITLVSHHMGDTTEDLDEVVYSITSVTGPHGEVLISDTGEVETNERETIVVYGTEEDLRLHNSCESTKKTLL